MPELPWLSPPNLKKNEKLIRTKHVIKAGKMSSTLTWSLVDSVSKNNFLS